MKFAGVSRAMLLAALGAMGACATDHAIVASLDSGGSAGIAGVGESASLAGQTALSELAGGGGAPAALPAPSSGVAGVANVGGVATSSASSAGRGPGLGGAAGRPPNGGHGGEPPWDDDSIGFAGFGSLDPSAFEGVLCSCIGAPARFCGVDGVTYSCAGGCPEVQIACLHDCPCDEAQPEPPDPSFWLPPPVALRQCGEGFVCLGDPSTSSFE